MDYKKLIQAAEFAKERHKGQLDDTGKDYYQAHLYPVYSAVGVLTDDTDIVCAAVLHDILEDTETTYEELAERFGLRVADLVYECTDAGEKDNYGKYFPRLKSAGAIMIKLCDRASNISRMETWDEKRKQQYLKRTKFWKDGSDLKSADNKYYTNPRGKE